MNDAFKHLQSVAVGDRLRNDIANDTQHKVGNEISKRHDEEHQGVEVGALTNTGIDGNGIDESGEKYRLARECACACNRSKDC